MSQCWLWTTKYRLGYPKRILVSNVNVNKTIFKLIYYSLFAGWIMINTKILWPWNYLSIFPFFIFFFFWFWRLCSISIISNIINPFPVNVPLLYKILKTSLDIDAQSNQDNQKMHKKNRGKTYDFTVAWTW